MIYLYSYRYAVVQVYIRSAMTVILRLIQYQHIDTTLIFPHYDDTVQAKMKFEQLILLTTKFLQSIK